MEIGEEEKAVTVEPIEDPFTREVPVEPAPPVEVPDAVPAEWEPGSMTSWEK